MSVWEEFQESMFEGHDEYNKNSYNQKDYAELKFIPVPTLISKFQKWFPLNQSYLLYHSDPKLKTTFAKIQSG